MAASGDRIQSLVIFNEIRAEYSLSDDIECRFYVDPSLDCSLDRIGLYRVGWTHKQDFIVHKDVRNCTTDEFDERRLLFPANDFPDGSLKEEVEYQFCYFHPFGDRKTYQLCGRSESFRFFRSAVQSPEGQRNASPSAPEISIHYPLLELDNLDINRTNPKTLYDINDDLRFNEFLQNSDICRNSTPKMDRRSVDYELEAKDRELSELKASFEKQNRIKELQIEKLKASVRSAEERVTSLKYELQTKVQNENTFEGIHNELMDTIKVTEAKNSSLEEQIHIRDKAIKQLKGQCSVKERLTDELREKLAISMSELDIYQSRNLEAIDLEDNRHQELKQENRQLKDKLQEVMKMSEKLKENNDRLIREKRLLDKIKVRDDSELKAMAQTCAELTIRSEKAEQERTDALLELQSKEVLIKKYAAIIGEAKEQSNRSVDDFLAESRRAVSSSITVFSNEMTDEVQNFCLERTKEALKKYSDLKSMADFVVYAMDDQFGNCWNCFIGQDFAHNSLLHVFGTYFSFAINDLKIIVYKTNDMPDYCQVIRWAKESPKVDLLFKTEYTDNEFEDLVVGTVSQSIAEDFGDYSELGAHLTRVLNTKYGPKYGFNWLAICGESDRFDTNLLLFSKKYKFIELEINLLKVIVIQFDEKVVENTNSLFKYKKFCE